MSQERTEQFAFDPEKVRKLLVDLVKDSLIHGLPISSQKYVLSDLAEAHEEIERMDIVIAEQADYINTINKSSDALDTAVYLHMCHIDRLNSVIVDREKHIEWMTACAASFTKRFDNLMVKVQERDCEVQSLEKEKQMYAEGLEQKRVQLYEKDERIEQLQLDQNYHIKKIERLETALEDSRKRVYELIEKGASDLWQEKMRQKPVPRDKAVAELELKNQDQEVRIAEDAELIKNQGKEIERLRAEVDGLRKVIKEKDKRIDQLRILYPSIWSRIFMQP